MPISFTGAHVPKDMTRTGIGWYVPIPCIRKTWEARCSNVTFVSIILP
jgi:hypothetical protein